ncbi:MAG: TIGR00341 family protein [Halolamina sp.]
MRLVQVMVPAGERRAVLDVLDEQGVDYVLADETSGREYTAVVSFPLPTNAVEPVLDDLRAAGLDDDAYTVVVDAETVVSRQFDQLRAEYDDAADTERIAREELVARAKDLTPDWVPFVVLTTVSAVVATAGLLLDSPAIVVGSMVIAPLIGPAMATGIGTVVDDAALFRRGLKRQAVGAVLAVAAAAAFAGLLRVGNVVPLGPSEVFAIGEVRERLVPDVLSLAVALGAGVAGALSLSSGVSAALVGVMIAAALVPPIAVVGIGLAWGEPGAVVGSAVLLVVNFVAINFAALGVLWLQEYRPESWLRTDAARRDTLTRIAVLGAAILLLTSFLAGVTLASSERATFEDRVRDAAATELADSEATVLAVEVTYGQAFPFRTPRTVSVTVGYPPDADPPAVADDIAVAVGPLADGAFGLGVTESEVTVEVRYVPHERVTVGAERDSGASAALAFGPSAFGPSVSGPSTSERAVSAAR